MRGIVRRETALILVLIAAWSVGCEHQNGGVSSSADPQEIFHQNMLSEVGEILLNRKIDSKPPPASAADLSMAQAGWPVGYKAIKDGNVVVLWGVPVKDGIADKIIAHEQTASESGGFVLMQDGKTVKKMTAEEFKAAPKAGK